MDVSIIITYKDFYSDPIPSVDHFVDQLPTKETVILLCDFCAKLHISPSDLDNQYRLLSEFEKRLPHPFYNKIHEVLNSYGPQKGVLFDMYYLTELLSLVIQRKNENKINSVKTTPWYNLMMAILVINDCMHDKLIKPYSENEFERFCQITWPYFHGVNLRTKTRFEFEYFRSLNFISYVKNSRILLNALRELTKSQSDEKALEYPNKILVLYVHYGMNKNSGRMNGHLNLNLETFEPLLERYVFDLEKYSPKDIKFKNYQFLRNKPLIKVEENKYLVSNWNFILHKFYNRLLIDLYQTSVIRSSYKNFRSFKGVIGKEFSEFYVQQLFEILLAKNDAYTFTRGEDDGVANHDFYIRRDNFIAFIESKDTSLSSFENYEDMKDELDKKFVKRQGAGQLKKIIEKFSQFPHEFDRNLKSQSLKRFVIFPILLVTDATVTMSGIEEYANRFMKAELKNTHYPFYVRDLIIMDVHTLANLNDEIKHGKKDIFDIINLYYKIKFKLKKKGRAKGASVDEQTNQYNSFSEVFFHQKNLKVRNAKPGSFGNELYKEMKRLGMES